jgi:DNA-binding HxlR family transcriptional regulator
MSIPEATAVASGCLIVPPSWSPRGAIESEGKGVAGARPPRPLSPVEATAALLRGRHTALVIWRLFWGGKRFYQLVRELPGVPRKAIAHELQELERAGVVRRLSPGGPGRIEYKLTPSGEGLKIVVGAMYEWGLRFRAPVAGLAATEPVPGEEFP